MYEHTKVSATLSLCMYNSTHAHDFVRRPPFGTLWTRKPILLNIQRYEKDRRTNEQNCSAGADPEIFQRGVEEKNIERKMFVDTRINACTHKN